MSPSLKKQNEKIANYFLLLACCRYSFSHPKSKKNKVKKAIFPFQSTYIYIYVCCFFTDYLLYL